MLRPHTPHRFAVNGVENGEDFLGSEVFDYGLNSSGLEVPGARRNGHGPHGVGDFERLSVCERTGRMEIAGATFTADDTSHFSTTLNFEGTSDAIPRHELLLVAVRVLNTKPPATARDPLTARDADMTPDRLLDLVGRPGGPLADASLWRLEVVIAR